MSALAIGMQDEGPVVTALCRAQPNRYLLEMLIPLGLAGQASKRRLSLWVGTATQIFSSRGVCMENIRQQWSEGFVAISCEKAPIGGNSAAIILWLPRSYAKALFSFMKKQTLLVLK